MFRLEVLVVTVALGRGVSFSLYVRGGSVAPGLAMWSWGGRGDVRRGGRRFWI